MVDPRDDPIELVPSRYAEWHDRFLNERERVQKAMQSRHLDYRIKRIEHVGSTAVPDIAAKDILDVNIVVEDDAVNEVSKVLESVLGGDRFENTPEWQPFFRIHDGQRFNDHVFAASSNRWKVSVVTRDVLREHTSLREEYEQLKRKLSAEYDDLVAYSEGKSAFIARVLKTAREDDDLQFEFEIPIES